MFKIKTINAISTNGLSQFPRENYEVSPDMSHPDAILVRSQNMHEMNLADTVRVIGRAGAGVNNIPVPALTKKGIVVLNTPGANANAVREIVLAGMLLASRNIFQAGDFVRNLSGTTEELESEVEKNKKQFVGFEILGKTLGIVGLGNVGVKVANAAIKLGMRVIGFDPTITVSRAWELSSKVQQAHSIDELLMQSDFVSFHVPLTKETRNMIDVSCIRSMKDNVVLLNFARDGIIDNDALLEALIQKKVFAYVCDFPNATLKDHPRVLCLPHLGASTQEAEENCAVMIVKQVRVFLENGTITHSVNFPSIEMPRSINSVRLAIANENIPNMVAQISAKLATAKLNIISLSNKSRDDIAYTLIDINDDVNDALLKEIATIQGVVQVRKIPA